MNCYSHANPGLSSCRMFAPLLESCPQHTHPSFPRRSALSLSGPCPLILTPDCSTSCSGPCSDLMAFHTVLPSLVTLHSPLRPTSLFIPSVLITYPPCFKHMFDTYTYMPCRYLLLVACSCMFQFPPSSGKVV